MIRFKIKIKNYSILISFFIIFKNDLIKRFFLIVKLLYYA